MRKQYSFRRGEDGLDAWDVHRLVELSATLPVTEVPLEHIFELDSDYWDLGSGVTVRDVASHVALVLACDLRYPIILGEDGRVMDGMHRVVRALCEERATISARRFEVDPPPDFTAVTDPDELPYE